MLASSRVASWQDRKQANPPGRLEEHVRKLRALGARKEAIDVARRKLAPGASLKVVVGDRFEGDERLTMIISPESRIGIGFESEAHFKAARKLVKRVAKALGYAYGAA